MKSKQEKLSIIDEGFTLEGEVSFNGQLVVKGTVKGTLKGEQIVVAEGGVVLADTQADFITIAGKFHGNLKVSEKMTLLSTGTCTGKIVCKDMEMEPGGVLNGEVCCK